MACAASLRRSRADSSRASLRARASRASASRSCTSRNAFSRRFSVVSAIAKIVGGLAALALGGGDGVEQLAAPLLDLGGEIGERGKIGAGLFLARAQGQDLLARIGDALLPKLLSRRAIASSRSCRRRTSRSKPSSAASARAAAWRLIGGVRLGALQAPLRAQRARRAQGGQTAVRAVALRASS